MDSGGFTVEQQRAIDYDNANHSVDKIALLEKENRTLSMFIKNLEARNTRLRRTIEDLEDKIDLAR